VPLLISPESRISRNACPVGGQANPRSPSTGPVLSRPKVVSKGSRSATPDSQGQIGDRGRKTGKNNLAAGALRKLRIVKLIRWAAEVKQEELYAGKYRKRENVSRRKLQLS
jgi:hypothetical protein